MSLSLQSGLVSQKTLARYREKFKAARNGSYEDLESLASDLRNIPTAILSETVEVFLFHPSSRRGLKDASDHRRDALVFASLKGLQDLTFRREFRSSSLYTGRILEGWVNDLEYTALLHRKLVGFGNEKLLAQFTSYVSGILTGIMCVDQEGLSDAITVDVNTRSFIAALWYNSPVNEEHFDTIVSSHLCHCFATPFDFFETLLEASGDPLPAQAIAKKVISRLHFVLKHSPKKADTWYGYGTECSVILRLLHQPRQEVALELVRQGGLFPVMKVLRLCAAAAQKGAPAFEDEQEMTTAATCFVILYRFFNVDRSLVRKALRGGLIKAMFALAPWMEAMKPIQQSFLHDIDEILCQQLVGELVYLKTIRLMARCVKELLPEERRVAETTSDLFLSRWTRLEKTLIERLVSLRIHTNSQKVSKCDTCKNRFLNSSLMLCGRCHAARYCSSDCQRASWRSMDHKANCVLSKRGRTKDATAVKNDTDDDIITYLAISDLARHFESLLKSSRRGSEGAGVDASKDLIVIDYHRVPANISILSRAEFSFKDQPKIREEMRDHLAFKMGLTNAEKNVENGDVPLCVVIYRNGGPVKRSILRVSTAVNEHVQFENVTVLPGDEERNLKKAAELRPAVTYSEFNKARNDMIKREGVGAKLDVVDYVLSFCASDSGSHSGLSAVESFWVSEPGPNKIVLEKVFLDSGPAGRAARKHWAARNMVYRHVAPYPDPNPKDVYYTDMRQFNL